MSDDIQPYIDDILHALRDISEKEPTRKELEKEFKKFLEYGVPLDHAKQTLMKKYGGVSLSQGASGRTMIVDLKPGQSSVNVLGRVITVNPKEVTARGETKQIFFGIMGDESGTITFTSWRDFGFEKGDVLEISNAYTREWQGAVKLNFGDRTKVQKTDESKLPETDIEAKEYKVKDLRSGLGMIEVTARILEVNQREVEVDGKKKKVYSGILGDETGKAQYTSWHDFKLKAGDVKRISGGYVKSWKGIPQLTFDENAKVESVDSNKIPKKEITSRKLLLHELVEQYGGLDVKVEGTVLEIRKGSGFVQRCPECNRVIFEGSCAVHGKVDPVDDVRIKLVIDDGTGAVAGIIGKESTENLLGKTLVEWKELHESSTSEAVLEEMYKSLFAHRLLLTGNALSDEFGVTVIAKEATFVDAPNDQIANSLLQEMEELA
jgi:replication factor A1